MLKPKWKKKTPNAAGGDVAYISGPIFMFCNVFILLLWITGHS